MSKLGLRGGADISTQACVEPKPRTDPEYSARGPSSRPILTMAWSMPRYRISRYLLSPTWPWTCSRVLAKSMGKVPGTRKPGGSFSELHAGSVASAPPPLTAFCRHGSEPAEDERLPVDAGHVLLQSLPEYVRKAEVKPKVPDVRSAAAAKFKSGRAAPAFPLPPPCCRKPRPLQDLLARRAARPARPAHYLLPRNRSRQSKRAKRQNFSIDLNRNLIRFEI